ncbi:TolC family protein [Flavobacterium frigoris]|uniref:Outer membrane component of tripartite multidrug resistance system n=1 Tax=Flavobacterium frigoris (strain PS1) TaxID=1086011 RepID=H7FP14_FLAFP|nr:TolC family protein [Flavobacterium frigoris]EIA09815.1 outer membrane component of tripartite multidrug resistance system [Flavobacterium frigoris PS1]
MLVFVAVKAQSTIQDSIPLSLENVWKKAAVNSKEIKRSQLHSKSGSEAVKNAKSKQLPEIGINANYGKLANIPIFNEGILHHADFIPLEDHSIYGVTLDSYFEIYNGQRLKTNIQKESVKQELSKYMEEETTLSIHFEVAQAYLKLQLYLQYEKLVKQNVHQSEARLALIQKLYNGGVVLKSDLLRAQLLLSKQKIALTEIKNNAELVMQELNIFMGNPDSQKLKPTDQIGFQQDRKTMTYDEYVHNAIDKSPLQKIANQKVELGILNIAALKSDKLPRIGLFGEYSYSYPQIKLYPYENAPYLLGVVGVKLSYSISSIYHDVHKEEEAKILLEEEKIARENVEDNLRKVINKSYQRYIEDQEKKEVFQLNIEQATENYRILNQTYFNQLSLITDLLDADTQLLQAQIDLISAKIAEQLHYCELLKNTGDL